jgi:hypothetical protein
MRRRRITVPASIKSIAPDQGRRCFLIVPDHALASDHCTGIGQTRCPGSGPALLPDPALFLYPIDRLTESCTDAAWLRACTVVLFRLVMLSICPGACACVGSLYRHRSNPVPWIGACVASWSCACVGSLYRHRSNPVPWIGACVASWSCVVPVSDQITELCTGVARLRAASRPFFQRCNHGNNYIHQS